MHHILLIGRHQSSVVLASAALDHNGLCHAHLDAKEPSTFSKNKTKLKNLIWLCWLMVVIDR